VIPKQHRGKDVLSNLALACPFCNEHKGPNLAGIDPKSGKMLRLFHPRKDRWDEHFHWRGARFIGATDVGRTTIAVLAINHPLQLAVRQALIELGELPGIKDTF